MSERRPVNPAIIKMQNRANDASDAAHHYRDMQDINKNKVCLKSYNEGKSTAYSEAYFEFKKELERLKREWQNGCLREDDFRTY